MQKKTLIMDDFDKKILALLQKNAKLTAKEMTFELALSQTPIYERIKKLENLGVIKQYVAILDANIVNKALIVYMSLTVKEHGQEKRQQLIQDLIKLNDISECYQISGRYDFLLKVRFENLKEYRDFLLNQLSVIDNISKIDSQIVIDEIKSTTFINL